jgi:hypothetical protein
VSNIADLLEAQGLTWKAYMDAYPGNCNPSASVGTYYRWRRDKKKEEKNEN